MWKMSLALLSAVLLTGASAAQGNGQYGYFWKMKYYSDASKTTQVGSEILLCNQDEPIVRGQVTEYYDYIQGICD